MMGTAEQGYALVVTSGTWTGAPTGLSYQWSRCDSSGGSCSAISGATGTSYALTSSDVNRKVKVAVKAANSSGSTSYFVTSRLVYGPAPGNASAPSISGTTGVGSVLSAAKGSWSGSPTSYLYRWRRCGATGGNCIDISSATSSSYTVSTADRGFTLRVDVTASNKWGSAVAKSSATVQIP
jgi:hypothetical protein